MTTKLTIFLLAGFSAIAAQPASAAIALLQNRLVFNADKTSVSLRVRNQNPAIPYLAQGWIENDQQQKVHGPLVLLPPVQRIEPGADTQIVVRALPAAKLLRQDQETLFYLNLREIPPKNNQPNMLNIALQNRIKIFWRPAALKAPASAIASPWLSQLRLEKQGLQWQLKNPSAYYVTLIEARPAADKPAVKDFVPLMLAPGESALLAGDAAEYGSAPQLTYINDFGGQPVITFRCSGPQCQVHSNQVPEE